MRYSILGRSGLRVAKICLGTMTFGAGAAWSRSENESRAVFDAYAEAGGNFVDTANMYTGGESERIVGACLAADRERFVVCTKYANAVPGANDPNAAGSHRKSMMRSLDASLRRLGLEYIDVYMVHFWDFTTPIEEVHRALDDAVRAGKILHIGLSDVPAWVVSRAQTFADLRGLPPIACMQLEYSLVQRSIEREHLPLSKSLNVGLTAWSPLAGGILTGKYTGARAPDGSVRLDSMQLQPLNDRNRSIAAALDAAGRRIDVAPSNIALAWLIDKGAIPIVGATSAAQMRENMQAIEVRLDEATIAELESASTFDAGHPYNMLTWDMPMSLGFAGMFDRLDIPNFPDPIR